MTNRLKMTLRRRRSLTASALLAVVLLIALPAFAGDDGGKQLPPSSNPFAAYDALLNDTASRTLEQVQQPDRVETASTLGTAARTQSTPVLSGGNAVRRVEQLRPMIEPILQEVGIPKELVGVVVVESGGDPSALSPKGARGIWQLMPETARRYGLVVNESVDERLDVFKSTRAAAEYLRDLYAQFHNWPLALAAYNAGEQAVQRALARTGSETFSPAATALPLETQNYVPAVLHAIARFTGSPSLPNTQASPRIVYAAAVQ